MTLPPFDAPPPGASSGSLPPDARFDDARRTRAAVVGVLAAASGIGAVLGFGLRAGTPARGFNAIAATVAGDVARGVWGWDSGVTPLGIGALAAVMFGWGLLYARLAARARPVRAIAWAVGVAAVAWMLGVLVVVRRLEGEAGQVLGPGQLVVLHLVLAVTLVVGMRFALGRNDGGRRAAAHDEP